MKTEKKEKPKNEINLISQKYTKNNFKFTIELNDDKITFYFQYLEKFPIKTYGLDLTLNDIEKMEAFENITFKNLKKFSDLIHKYISSGKYDIILGNDESYIIFILKSEIFENDRAEIKINESGYDFNLKTEIESVKSSLSETNKKVKEMEYKLDIENQKEEMAKKSFYGNSFLDNDEKIILSKWIHPNRIIKFNLLYTTKDSDSSSYFHDYCDDIFPILIVIYDTSKRKFGGYSTKSFRQPTNSNYNCRAPGSFIFNLTNKKKYDLIDQNDKNAICRNNLYGPCFGFHSSSASYYDIFINNSCTSSTCYYQKNVYDTGSNNLLGSSGSTAFTVSVYEAYQVIFE